VLRRPCEPKVRAGGLFALGGAAIRGCGHRAGGSGSRGVARIRKGTGRGSLPAWAS
jgi:hypothetical protein